MKTTGKLYTVLLSLVFAGWIGVPLIFDSFPKPGDLLESKSENRMLARRPKMKLTRPDDFPQAYEKFYNDHFFLRYELIHLNTLVVDYYLFSRSPIPLEVAFGANGWLFTTGREREIYDGRFNLPDDYVEAMRTELHGRALEYRKLGIKFYVAVAPMKSEIYPEYLPAYYTRTEKPIFTERVLDLLGKDTLYHLIDLKAPLLEGKKSGEVFYRTDNHWNGQGAWDTYSFITGCMSRDFPSIKPLKRPEIAYVPYRFSTGNLATLAGLQLFIKEFMYHPVVLHPRSAESSKFGYRPPPLFGYPDEYEIVRTVPDNSLPRIVVIRDSFFAPMLDVFSENFRKSVYIFDAWKYGPNYDIVAHEKPDIVLLEIYGPNLSNLLSSLAGK